MDQIKIPDYLTSEYSEFLEYLPLHFENKEEDKYINNLISTFNINYHHQKYESAFFNLHILYMIIVYSYILKIKNNNLEDFYISLISLDKSEVKKYQERFQNKKINLFDFSMFKENNVFCFFEILGFSEPETKLIKESVNKRNVYAHPRGRIIIDTDEKCTKLIQNNINGLKLLHEKMVSKIRNIFILLLDSRFDDFGEELNELEQLRQDELTADEEGKKLIKSNIDKTNNQIYTKFRDILLQPNYFNKKDIINCIDIEIEEYNKMIRFAEKKKLFEKFKELFKEEN